MLSPRAPCLFDKVLTVWERFTPGSPDTCTLCLGSRAFSLNSLLSNTRLHALTFSYMSYIFHFSNLSITVFVQGGRGREASLEHAQCARARVIGRDSQEAGEPLNTNKKGMDMDPVKCEKYDHI